MFSAVRCVMLLLSVFWRATAVADPLLNDFPARLSETELFFDTASLTPAPELIAYSVRVPLWSDGADKKRWFKIPEGEKISFRSDEIWKLPVGSSLIKHFEIRLNNGLSQRLETRVITRRSGGYAFASYRWEKDQSDATLIENGSDETYEVFDAQDSKILLTWHYPSSAECRACHNRPSEPVLGFHTRQLNLDDLTTEGIRNQIEAWQTKNLFDGEVPNPSTLPRFPTLDLSKANRREKARAYLDVNCAHCHQPGGGAPGGIDMRYATPISRTQLLWIPPAFGNLGIESASRIEPYDKGLSVLWHRIQNNGGFRMPPLGSNRIDVLAVELLGRWIDEGAL